MIPTKRIGFSQSEKDGLGADSAVKSPFLANIQKRKLKANKKGRTEEYRELL